MAAEWYHADVPRKRMKQLMRRADGPALRDSAIWIGLLVLTGVGGGLLWGSWACVPFFIVYGVLYGSASDSRWHETGHGTAFRTSWLNDVLYQIASFMNMKEATFWRWSHARHHTDTIIVGRDREIAAMRPPGRAAADRQHRRAARCLGHGDQRRAPCRRPGDRGGGHLHPRGRAPQGLPRGARLGRPYTRCVVALAIVTGSLLPLMYVGLPTLYGRWLSVIFGISQHAGLAENVLDHRLNARTIEMNPVFRFLYWNMNYHVEHHMFPMVPYHALPQLHAEVAADLPVPYPSLLAAYREIIPTLLRQMREPEYYVRRTLPEAARPFRPEMHDAVFEVTG